MMFGLPGPPQTIFELSNLKKQRDNLRPMWLHERYMPLIGSPLTNIKLHFRIPHIFSFFKNPESHYEFLKHEFGCPSITISFR